MENKKQTYRSFSEKWKNNKKLAFNTTLEKGSDIYNWILNRNGFANTSQFKKWVSKKKNILDAGCGNGRVCALFRKYAPKETNITIIASDQFPNPPQVGFDILNSPAPPAAYCIPTGIKYIPIAKIIIPDTSGGNQCRILPMNDPIKA